ncbi:signal peptide peptidase SppA [Bacteriovoracales bacterium]|nr:signal peptide peptidase SppA [Bacteriovoracales bacterium]
MSESRSRGIMGILLMVLVFFIILVVFAFYTVGVFKKNTFQDNFSNKGGSIAVVEINGVIMDSKKTIEKLHIAEKDKKYDAIIVRINSPGGAVGPSQEIYHEIRRIDQDKKSGKPVYSSFGSIAASGGYYIGAAGRKIFSNSGCLTGSIGVIMQFMDLSKLFKYAKINPNVIKSGKYKDVGQPTRALTRGEKSLMKKLLKGVHAQFVDDILLTRKEKIKGNIWAHAQGQVFSGKKALEYGLVDELGGLWEAGRKIHKELGLKRPFGLSFIKVKKKLSLMELVEGFDQAAQVISSGNLFRSIPMFLYRN